MTETNIDLQNTEETPTTDLQKLKDVLKNKQKIRLLYPYSENATVKKLGAKYDNVNRYWYYPSIDGELPSGLKNYRAHKIFIEYENKEYFYPILKSMKFDKIQKIWYIDNDDYELYLQLC
jgi:hypothetical protein